jgi:hypothetical protein
MDVKNVADEIESKVNEINRIRKDIRKRGEDKANAVAEYDRKLAVTIIQLKNGVDMELDGQIIHSPAATITEKIARGLCWKEKLAMEQTEGLLKSAASNLNAVEAQLSALQSIYKHLSTI